MIWYWIALKEKCATFTCIQHVCVCLGKYCSNFFSMLVSSLSFMQSEVVVWSSEIIIWICMFESVLRYEHKDRQQQQLTERSEYRRVRLRCRTVASEPKGNDELRNQRVRDDKRKTRETKVSRGEKYEPMKNWEKEERRREMDGWEGQGEMCVCVSACLRICVTEWWRD